MKLILLAAFISSTVFAVETKTECPWMKEMNKRHNPKANMEVVSKNLIRGNKVRGQ